MTKAHLRIGQIVKLTKPLNDDERQARFILLDDPQEMTGQRVDIQLICKLAFRPIQRVSADEIEAAAPIQWRLRSGLLYAGLNERCQCVLTTADKAVVFDDRDNEQAKAAFYGQMLHTRFEIELCAS